MKRLMDGIIRFLDEFQQNCSIYVDRIKFILYAVFAWYLATFSEVIPTFRIISIAFVVSMVIGTIVGINIKGELFSKTKFFKAIFEALCYLMSIWFVNEMGRTYNDHDLSNQVIKYVTYLVTWAYSCSIFKNLKLLFPSSKPIAIIYEILSTEIYKKLKNKYKSK